VSSNCLEPEAKPLGFKSAHNVAFSAFVVFKRITSGLFIGTTLIKHFHLNMRILRGVKTTALLLIVIACLVLGQSAKQDKDWL